jgi:hypothetical protein
VDIYSFHLKSYTYLTKVTFVNIIFVSLSYVAVVLPPLARTHAV